MTTTHEDFQELLGVYALDAVEEDERVLVEEHLESCPRCRAEVANHRDTAAALAYVGASAPDGLWDRITASLEEPPPGLQLTRLVPAARGAERVRLSARDKWLRIGAVAAAVVALLGVLGTKVVDQDRQIDQLYAALQDDAVERELRALTADPAARKVHLASPDGVHKVQAVIGTNGRGYLVTHNLPALAADQTYQLWGQVGERLVSLGVLGNDPDAAAFQVDGDLIALAVTTEIAGGVERSSNQPVVVGLVTS